MDKLWDDLWGLILVKWVICSDLFYSRISKPALEEFRERSFEIILIFNDIMHYWFEAVSVNLWVGYIWNIFVSWSCWVVVSVSAVKNFKRGQ